MPANSCSQMRITDHPRCFNVRFTNLSRRLLPESFCIHNSLLLTGMLACLGQPCQKQPSMKIAILWFLKMKSGRPVKLT